MWNLPYLIEVQICFSLAWLLYRFVLGRDSEFVRNRAYLLFSAAVAFIVPLLSIPVFPGQEVVYSENGLSGFTVTVVDGSEEAEAGFDWGRLILWGYLAGTLVMTGVLVRGALRLWLKTRRLPVVVVGDARISYVEHMGPAFSFFNRIYLDVRHVPQDEIPQVLTHELSHVRLHHSWDMVFAQAVRILLWWNPFVWLWVRSLKEVHEFQADAAVLDKGFDSEQYIKLILQRLTGIHPEFASGFSYSLVKKRLMMMTKEKPKRFAGLKVLLSLPLAGVMLLLFSFTERAPRITVPNDVKVYYVDGEKSSEKDVNELAAAGKILRMDAERGDSVKITRVTTVGNDNDSAVISVESGISEIEFEPEKDLEVREVTVNGGKSERVTVTSALFSDQRIKRMTDADTTHVFGKIVFKRSGSGGGNVKLFVDGVERPASDMDKLDSDHIASVSVVKNQKDGGPDRIMVTTKEAENIFSEVKHSADAARLARLSAANARLSAEAARLKAADARLLALGVRLSDSLHGTFVGAELYVDGVKCDMSDLDKINANDIASMSVIKDQKDGSADRVMLITKSVKSGKAFVSLSKSLIRGNLGSEVDLFVDGVKKDMSALEKINTDDIDKIVVMKDQKDGSADRIMITTKSAQKEPRRSGKAESGQDGVVVHAEHMPEFSSASGTSLTAFRGWVTQRLRNYLRSSAGAGEENVRERVVVSFVVEKDGSVGRVNVLQASSSKLRAKAVQIVKSSPKWAKPGRDKSGPVAVKFTMPIEISVQK